MSAPRRVFIVEDQRLIAADLANTLRRLGYDVVGSAASGEEAVEAAPGARPELVLMDIRLQGPMDGIAAAGELLRRIDVPVVYLTAYADEETIRRAKLTGPFGYVVKPFNERELRAGIEVALYKHDTERLLAEERARREAAEEFQLLVHSAQGHSIIRLEPGGRVASWNVGAERLTGYRAEEALGRHVEVFYAPEDVVAGAPRRDLERAAREGRAEREGWRVRRDGARVWTSAALTALRDPDGRLRGFAEVTRDLTERRRREEHRQLLDQVTLALTRSLDDDDALRRAADLLVPALAGCCLVHLVDAEGRLARTIAAHPDPALAAALATTTAHGWDADARGPARAVRTRRPERHPEAGAAPDAVGAGHAALLRALEATAYVAAPIATPDRAYGALTLVRVGPATAYDDEELALVEELARRAALALDNARLYREAREAIRARDEFLQVASHELKTPLTPLLLQLDTLAVALRRGDGQDERLAAKVDVAARQTLRLDRLVDSLLDVARITGGRLELQPEEADLVTVVREVVERFQAEARRAGCELALRARAPVRGRWDRLRLEQVASNLLSNAIKYGQGRPVEVAVDEAGGVARLTVADGGIGIDEEGQRRIFSRFERAASARHYGGLGLGLFITRCIVEAHAGTIAVSSRPGEGATFTVQLPTEGGAA
ncbi:MAG: response regulator [Planctomycetes bacterium]|nr:response regulator [Planctomycetota bacterium]